MNRRIGRPRATALLGLALLASGARAADEIAMTCADESMATAIFVRTRGDQVVADFVHRKGVGYVPLTDDAPTVEDLPALAQRAKFLQSLGSRWTFRWRRADCRKTDERLFDCTKAEWQTVNGQELKPFSFWSTRAEEQDVHMRWETTKLKLYLLTRASQPAESVLTFPFPSRSCAAQEDAGLMASFGIEDEN